MDIQQNNITFKKNLKSIRDERLLWTKESKETGKKNWETDEKTNVYPCIALYSKSLGRESSLWSQWCTICICGDLRFHIRHSYQQFQHVSKTQLS